MNATLQFLGAAETVTGSKHLLRVDGKTYLIDCGLFQGSKELKERNWKPLSIPPHEIDAVLITHAHIDHIGYLPRLVKDGYAGPIHCTAATAEITRLSLPDSGHLQEEYARYANKKGFSEHEPALPLYTVEDAHRAAKLLKEQKFDEVIFLERGCSFRYRRAGHILGSAFIEFFLPDGRNVLFSGDLGRFNTPIIRDPVTMESADVLLIESTYGDRVHAKTSPGEELLEIVREVQQSGGMIVIPAFAIGRTQDVLYYLHELQIAGRLPDIQVYVDSPMAVDATGIYARHHEDHDIEMEKLEEDNLNPLKPKYVHFVRTVQESKKINEDRGPGIIIASSGMATGGRVVHHLARRLPDPANIVLFVGYQAEGTLGRRLTEGAPKVKIMGDLIPVRASVRQIGSLSAHADSDEIMDWLRGFKVRPKATYIVHGEPPAQAALQQRMRAELGWESHVPKMFETVTI
ncbi:MAG: MBL fold metallo-hydrolase [Armatimonadetes bacterium]|nr:MBL fold metallo-hydrolase [Armatimonadota bacterium]